MCVSKMVQHNLSVSGVKQLEKTGILGALPMEGNYEGRSVPVAAFR